MKDWLPKGLPELHGWLINFVAKLTEYKSLFNIPNGVITEFTEDIEWLNYYINCSLQIEAEKKAINKEKRTFVDGKLKAQMSPPQQINLPAPPATPPKAGLRKRIRNQAATIKLLTDVYTSAIGLEMKIELVKDAPALDTLIINPKEVSAQPNDQVKITFAKGAADSLLCEMSLDGVTYKRVGTPSFSPFMDETPSADGKSEKRFYRFRPMVKNTPVGVYSPVYTIQTTP